MKEQRKRRSVGIIGAGVSGLRCATVLLENDVDVTIVEARDRLGGRVSVGIMIKTTSAYGNLGIDHAECRDGPSGCRCRSQLGTQVGMPTPSYNSDVVS